MDLKQELLDYGVTGIVESTNYVETDYVTVEIKENKDFPDYSLKLKTWMSKKLSLF
jgi:hypothetical protein